MYVTDDAHFEPGSATSCYANGFPSMAGIIRVAVERPVARAVSELLGKRRGGAHASTAKLLLVGRSGHAQVGVDIEIDASGRMSLDGSLLTIPVVISALGPIREPWLESIMRLARSGRQVRVGRVLIIDWSDRLGRREVLDLIEQKLVAADDAVVNPDGSLSVPIEETEFVPDTRAFSEPHVREAVLIHSRSALVGHQDIRPFSERRLAPRSLTVLGIRFSSGPCPAIIRPEVGEGVHHLHAGLFLDPYRSTRIGRDYGAMGLRQVELFNNAAEPSPPAGTMRITLDLFPPPKQPAHLMESFATPEKRAFSHQHGTPLSSIIRIRDEAARSAIFDGVTEMPAPGATYAKIITPNGATRVAWATSPRFQRALTEHGITNPTGQRSEEAALRRAAEALVYSVDQARLFVSWSLPQADELFLLSDLGVKAFLFRGFSPPRTRAGNGAASGPYMTGHLHETIHVLWKSGVSFIHCPPQPKREVREFHKGFWCSIPAKPRYEDVTTIINMYGSHSDAMVPSNRRPVQAFVDELVRAVPARELAFMHGKGRGFMGLADEIARKNGLLSMGVGIDVEIVGQTTNPAPELALDFTSAERAYRQKLMDHLGLFKIFNIGGYGTLEEAAITICSTKLLENMATPIIFVDETNDKRFAGAGAESAAQHLWQDLAEQARVISSLASARVEKGRTVDLAKRPLGQAWVKNILHCARSYREAGAIIAAFVADPGAYWARAGISEAEITGAWRSYSDRMAYYGLSVPGFLAGALGKRA